MAASPLFHDLPGRPGYARYDIDLVSPEVPSGAAWLVNCLLELGISAWKPWGTDDRAHWQHLQDFDYRYVGGDNGWTRVLPALTDGRDFAFRAQPCVRAHHAWPGVHPPSSRTILFVRDPRDALLSAWHRLRRIGTIAPEQDFIGFCRSPFFHYPISWQDYLLLFLRAWRAAFVHADGLVVRFEDYRRDAAGTLLAVLRYLGVEATEPAVQAAVATSAIDRVGAEDRRLHAAGIVPSTIVRGVPSGEYARQFDDAAHRLVGARFDDVGAWLGYEPSPMAAGAPRAAHSREQVHAGILDALRKAGIPIDDAGWLAAALFDCAADIDFTATTAS
jgi:hypothetical protein